MSSLGAAFLTNFDRVHLSFWYISHFFAGPRLLLAAAWFPPRALLKTSWQDLLRFQQPNEGEDQPSSSSVSLSQSFISLLSMKSSLSTLHAGSSAATAAAGELSWRETRLLKEGDRQSATGRACREGPVGGWWVSVGPMSGSGCSLLPGTQGRNEGGKGGIIPRAPNHCGVAEKSQQRHKYFLQNSTFAPKDLRFEHGGDKLASCPGRYLTSLRPCSHDKLRNVRQGLCSNYYGETTFQNQIRWTLRANSLSLFFLPQAPSDLVAPYAGT